MEKLQELVEDKLSELSLEELKELTPEKITSLEGSKKLFFNLMENIISSTLKGKTQIEVLDLLGEISKRALDVSASAYAREIQKGTDDDEGGGGEEEQ